jgi:hypothetical protein
MRKKVKISLTAGLSYQCFFLPANICQLVFLNFDVAVSVNGFAFN